jgi:hypothetical protein
MRACEEAIALPVIELNPVAFLDDPLQAVQYCPVGEATARRPDLMPLGVHFQSYARRHTRRRRFAIRLLPDAGSRRSLGRSARLPAGGFAK